MSDRPAQRPLPEHVQLARRSMEIAARNITRGVPITEDQIKRFPITAVLDAVLVSPSQTVTVIYKGTSVTLSLQVG